MQERRAKKAMNHQQIEIDIRHLEHMLTLISIDDRIPLSYWRKRLDQLVPAALVPGQRIRIKKLDDALRMLEARATEGGNGLRPLRPQR
jgi:hypothetical protein